MAETDPVALDLIRFIEASPTPWHAVAEVEGRLEEAGYRRFDEGDMAWSLEPGSRGWVERAGGSILAFRLGSAPPTETGLRIIAAHTDSPNLRIKPRPDRNRHGYASLGVEVYGGVLLSTWLDRDLSLAGRVCLRGPGEGPLQVETRLLRIERPLCRIPNLAIHLNRGVNKDGLVVNPQEHLPPIWSGTDDSDLGEDSQFQTFLASELGVEPEQILSWEMCLYDVQPPSLSGRNQEFIQAPRLDNLGSCHPAVTALLDTDGAALEATSIVALMDHEEIGSRTTRGAASAFIRDILTRLTGPSRAELTRSVAKSVLISADMAHGVHPNYSERHDQDHMPRLNGGPALKTHANWRYATDAETMGLFRGLCQDEGVPLQDFITRTDLPCGSTVGPILAANLGIRALDVGNSMLSMHSIREMAGSRDPALLIRAMSAFLKLPKV